MCIQVSHFNAPGHDEFLKIEEDGPAAKPVGQQSLLQIAATKAQDWCPLSPGADRSGRSLNGWFKSLEPGLLEVCLEKARLPSSPSFLLSA